MKKVYLAGPDVFLENAREVFEQKKEICRKYGFEPLTPLDTELNDKINGTPSKEIAAQIYEFDVSLMDRADAVLANMEPFRGPSMDVGTAFEMGYMTALKKPIVGYSEDLREYALKTADDIYSEEMSKAFSKFSMFEDFGLIDNLMMVQSVRSQDIEIVRTFEEAVRLLATMIQPCHPCHERCTHRDEGEKPTEKFTAEVTVELPFKGANSVFCDNPNGPCYCGAWHKTEEK